jgi:hypothetical protein
MWRINSSRLTLQEVLIMAYMNVLEGTSERAARRFALQPAPGLR